MLITPEDHRISIALRFDFRASNNEAEYEVLIAGLRLASELRAENIVIFSDSQLVVNQVLENFQARDPRMVKYLSIVRAELAKFVRYDIVHVGREENVHANMLAQLATTTVDELKIIIAVEILRRPSISPAEDVMEIDRALSWMDVFVN